MVDSKWTQCFGATLMILLYILSLYVFSSGFLLMRTEIYEYSNCSFSRQRVSPFAKLGEQNNCWTPVHYDRAVIVLIDALRYDFAASMPLIADTIQDVPQKSFLKRFVADPPTTTLQRLKALTTGSLPTFIDAGANFGGDELLEDSWMRQLVKNGRRVAFAGDETWTQLFPPQSFFARTRASNASNRSSNSAEREQDSESESEQLLAFGFPSFNVHDLDTVDSAIRERMPKLLGSVKSAESDWDVLIMHFLGIDHAGHRYGATHTEMRRKINEMNTLLEDLRDFVDKSPQRTILLAFGDHGMTESGDHGGDAGDELDSALFAYSNRPFRTAQDTHDNLLHADVIAQVDLVPTISLLLGVPVPFSSLGCLITDLFVAPTRASTVSAKQNQAVADAFELVRALEANVQQVTHYLRAYATRRGGVLSEEALQSLFDYAATIDARFDTVANRLGKESNVQSNNRDSDQLLDIARDYVKLLREVKALCGAVWSTFQLGYMFVGLLSFTITLCWHFRLVRDYPIPRLSVGCHLVTLAVVTACVFYPHQVAEQLYIVLALCGFLLGVLFYRRRVVTTGDHQMRRTLVQSVGSWLPIALYCVALASNSYVVNEAYLALFLLQTSMCITVCTQLCTSASADDREEIVDNAARKRVERSRTKRFVKRLRTSLVLLFVALCASRCAVELQTCREEQSANWCSRGFFLKQSTTQVSSYSANVDDRVIASKQNLKFWSSFLCSVAIYMVYRTFLARNGHLFGLLAGEADGLRALLFSLLIRYLVPLQIVLIGTYDALQLLPKAKLDALLSVKQVFIPRAVYTISLLLVAMLLRDPFRFATVRLVPRASDQRLLNTLRNSVKQQTMQPFVRSLFKEVYKPMEESGQQQPTAIVYGLATLFSATLFTVLMAAVYPLLILSGLQYAPAFLCFFVAAVCIVELNQHPELTGKSSTASYNAVVQLFLLSSVFFYAFGLQPTLTNIRWNAAFVGYLSANTSTLQQGSLIMLSTFASSLIVALILPTLITRTSRNWLLVDSLVNEVSSWFSWLRSASEQEERGEDEEKHNERGRRSKDQERSGESRKLNEPNSMPEIAELGEVETAYFTRAQPQCTALPRQLCNLFLCFAFVHAILLLTMMIVVTVHRRHLFVWKIFAPRFIYQTLNFACSTVFSVSAYLMTVLIHGRLVSWYNEQLLINLPASGT